jgi:hypothetical protein
MGFVLRFAEQAVGGSALDFQLAVRIHDVCGL